MAAFTLSSTPAIVDLGAIILPTGEISRLICLVLDSSNYLTDSSMIMPVYRRLHGMLGLQEGLLPPNHPL